MNAVVPEVQIPRLRSDKPAARRRICIVTGELAGPLYNGGIGTTNRALASVLRGLGHDVDVLYTRVHEGKPICLRGSFAEHVEAFRKVGVRLVCIDHRGNWYDWSAVSYRAMQHLIRNQYDLVFFDDLFGNGYYSLLARRSGNPELSNTTMCVTTHSATQWIKDTSQLPITTVEQIRLAEMERRSIELADAVKAPSAYILEKYRNYGWTLPDHSVVLPNFVFESRREVRPHKRVGVREIVFFGRLEHRKGLWLFCRALDRLKYRLKGCQVTFLGKTVVESDVSTGEILLRRSAAWPFPIRVLSTFDRDQALAYLRGEGRIAIMPSLEDNSPSGVLECLEEGIPFLTTCGSGAEELIENNSGKAVLFEPTVESLCAKLLQVLADGAVTGRPSLDGATLEKRFAEWLERVASSTRQRPHPVADIGLPKTPVLVVIVPTHNVNGAVSELSQVVDACGGNIRIHVLAESVSDFKKDLANLPMAPLIQVSGLREFEGFAKSLAAEEPAIVGLCHISQIISLAWFERARDCFANDERISAVTGMVATGWANNVSSLESFVSASHEYEEIGRFLTGNSTPLFALARETNSGFALLRSELLGLASGVSPVDDQYDRLKQMEDWIHEILVTLHLQSKRFELVPDLLMRRVQEQQFEVFRLAHFMRSLRRTLYGYAPGTDQWLLASLAIDWGLDRERARSHAKYVTRISERIGENLEQLRPYAPWDQQVQQLATVAHAGGQIDLALDLCAELAGEEDHASSLGLDEQVSLAIDTVSLAELLAKAYYEIFTAGPASSVRINADVGEVEMQVYSRVRGLTGIIFPLVDLNRVNEFAVKIILPESKNRAVRFWIEMVSADRSHKWSAQEIVSDGSEREWQVEIPTLLQGKCTVLLGAELTQIDDTWESVAARWIDPRFVRRISG
jgi:glycosyltransferase involved in cell wall biosynthesis